MVFDIYRLERGGNEVFSLGQSYAEFAETFLPKLASAGLEVPETENSTLCDRCAAITFPKLKGEDGYMLLDDVSALEDSAEKCDMCRLVLLSLRSGAGDSPYTTSRSQSLNECHPMGPRGLCKQLGLDTGAGPASVYLKLDGTVLLGVKIKGGGYSGFCPILKIHARPGSLAVAAGIPPGLPICREPNTEGHFFLFREWIRHCVEEHDQCSRPLTASKLPTRVLDVGEATGGPGNLRLYDTGRVPGRYITLSHRWGAYTPLKTTKALMGIHLKEILFANLPKTFRDAVTVTRKLGVRYLWIDSLCIIQDDPDDWLREAAVMGEIYAKAYCTLAATSARDSNDGLFIPRPASQSVKLNDLSGDSPVSFYASIEDRFEHDLHDGDLNNRGWVLQERFLSPRIIHFTAVQTFWECGSDRYSEDCVENSFKFLNDSVKHCLFPAYYEDRFVPRVVSPWPYLRLNERYSACRLTYDEDKIAAMTGMVSSIQERHNVHFNAGIWLTFPVHSLLWGRKRSARMRRLTAFDFPSWTWVAYDGEVEFLSGGLGFNPRHDLEMSIKREDGASKPFMSLMTLIGPVAPLNPDLCIDKGSPQITFAKPRAIKSSTGEPIGCAMFDDPDDDGEGVECLIVESQPAEHWQQSPSPRSTPGNDSAVTIKVRRGLQIALPEVGATFTLPGDDLDETSNGPIAEDNIRQELQLLEEAGIGPSEGGADISTVSTAIRDLDVQESGPDGRSREPPTPPFRNAWVFNWKYSWVKGYTVLFVRATDSTKTKFVRVGFGCLDNGQLVEEQMRLAEVV